MDCDALERGVARNVRIHAARQRRLPTGGIDIAVRDDRPCSSGLESPPEPSLGADVGALHQLLLQMRKHSGVGADVAGVSPVPVQMWPG